MIVDKCRKIVKNILKTHHKLQQIKTFLAIFQLLNNCNMLIRFSGVTGFCSTRSSGNGRLFILEILRNTLIASSSLPFVKSHRGDSGTSLAKENFFFSVA